MKYNAVLNYVQSLNLQQGQTYRGNCPSCNGHNSFTVTKDIGEFQWNCYRASCNVHGKSPTKMTAGEVLTAMKENSQEGLTRLFLPPYFTSILSDDKALWYIEQNHVMQAYNNHLVDLRYDPKMRRVVFLIYHNNVLVDAIGRAIDKSSIPKWYRYGNSSVPFICGTNNVGVVVEDCASACAVSRDFTGVAFLGTSMADMYIKPLKQFNQVYVALDKDAFKKGLGIQKKLSFYVNAKVVLLEDDLKYYSPDEIRELINE